MADGSIVIDTEFDKTKIKSNLQGIGKTMKAGLGMALKGAVAAAGLLAAAIAGIAKGAKKFAAVTDRVDKLSQRLGMSRTAFQEWESYQLLGDAATILQQYMSVRPPR